ncbi:hypothetical protein Plec18167_000325 [Paecilomyces lecythidis]|uniref:AB hydrolase-1 domain-containing protein n=1 Tax=Paecilomyces lecythidis TaxID=3004212 RepID=A0ABR3YEJ8_9EURO
MDALDEPLAPDTNPSRHRRSLTSRSTSAPAPQSADRANVPPASPEVISSLISSLSAISAPAQSHFDSFPNIDDHLGQSLPNSPQSETSRGRPLRVRSRSKASNEHGFGMDYGAYKALEENTDAPLLPPDDAAIAPVVRMAPAPSSSKPKNTSGQEGPLRPSSVGSCTPSTAAYDEFSGFGMISTEPGPRVSTANSIASSSSGGRRSLKGQLGLLKKASREFLQDKESDRLKKGGQNDSLKLKMPRSRASLRSIRSMADLTEEIVDDGDLAVRKKDDRESSDGHRVLSLPLDMPAAGPGGIGSGRLIPTRESSLRHSYGGTSSKKRRPRHARYSSTGSKDLKIEGGIAEANNEADQVTKRIQQLKEQQKKIKSELEIDDTPSNTPSKPRRSHSASRPQAARVSSEIRPKRSSYSGDSFLHRVEESGLDFQDESAPAPAVLTGTSSKSMKRNSGPLASKTTNIQPVLGKQSFDKSPRLDRSRSHRSVESSPVSGVKQHRRTPSGPLSQRRLSMSDERPSSADSIDLAVEAYIDSPRLTRRVAHPTTGRVIAFSDVGDPKGYVVVCCLGMGLTRYLMAFYDELARTLKLRLVTLDRPGVGESESCPDGTPLGWPDDVAIVCNYLKVTKFSILAHSAGAIYALATALRMPQHIRGRLHLLGPWIPPSQLSSIGAHKEPAPSNAVPYSQRILRALPTPILKVANSSFMSATSTSITTSLPKSPRRSKKKTAAKDTQGPAATEASSAQLKELTQGGPDKDTGAAQSSSGLLGSPDANGKGTVTMSATDDRERQSDYDNRLTYKIWELATTNANPAVDLLVCLERNQPIGFRYVDITRAVVIHHGSRDTRVPVDNVRWLGKTMRRCEVRVLEGEGHGLMASAVVMGNVLTEIAKEWEDWTTIVQGKRDGRRPTTNHSSRPGIVI